MQMPGEFLPRAVGVFVESVFEITAAEKDSSSRIAPVQRGQLLLGPDGVGGEDRVMIDGFVEDAVRGNLPAGIERNKVVLGFRDLLQGVHPIVGGGLEAALVFGGPVVP